MKALWKFHLRNIFVAKIKAMQLDGRVGRKADRLVRRCKCPKGESQEKALGATSKRECFSGAHLDATSGS